MFSRSNLVEKLHKWGDEKRKISLRSLNNN